MCLEISENDKDLIFLPFKRISPESILFNPLRHLIKVVFPVPFGPRIHKTSPFLIEKLISEKISSSSYENEIFLTSNKLSLMTIQNTPA